MPLPSFAVVDLETSGLSVRRHRILQLGMVVVDADGALLDRWSTLVRLRWPLGSVGPTHVHGITRSTLRGAPPLDEVLDDFTERLGDSLFTAHNAEFDGGFLDEAVRRRDAGRARVLRTLLPARSDDVLAPSSPEATAGVGRRLCTLRMSRRLDPDRALSHRLGDVCARYGVELARPHDALADATATAAVLPHLLRAHGVEDVTDLEPFLDPVTSAGGLLGGGDTTRRDERRHTS